MRRLALILSALALVVVGCGGGGDSAKEKYVAKFKPLNSRLILVSQDISDSLAGLDSGQPLGVKLNVQITQLDTVNNNIASLDTPDELRDESQELTRRVRASIATLKEISRAVSEGKEAKAASAAVELASRAQAVNRAQRRMADATGLKTP